jgi:hypothetical protein
LLLLLLLRRPHASIAKGHLVLQVLLQVVWGSVRPLRLLLAAWLPALIILTCITNIRLVVYISLKKEL